MAVAPIAPQRIAVTNADGRLPEGYLPDRLSESALDPEVDLVLLFENAMTL